MKTVQHHDRETAYRIGDRGSAERTILFVHGSGSDHTVWKAQDRLARTDRVVALDLSGHGASADIDTDAGTATLDAYVDDVAAVADATDADVLVGNSLGGAVVQWTLLTDSVSVDAAILVGSGAKLAVIEDLRTWLREDFTRAVEFLHKPDLLFTEEADPQLVEASKEALHDCGQAVTERDFLTCHQFDVRDQIASIETPLLAIGGRRDSLTPPTYHEFIAETVQNGQMTIVDDAAHMVMIERPRAFNAELRTFLDEVC